MDNDGPYAVGYTTGANRVILKESIERHESIIDYVKDRYISLFPSLSEFDEDDIDKKGFAFPVLLSYHLVVAAIFLAFFITGYISEMKQIYLAPLKGNEHNSLCNQIPISVNNKFKVDLNGYWEGDNLYDASKAIYEVSFSRVNIDNNEYKEMMLKFQSEVKEVSLLGQSYDLQYNLVALASFNSYYEAKQSGSVSFRLVGDATVIFSNRIKQVITTICTSNSLTNSFYSLFSETITQFVSPKMLLRPSARLLPRLRSNSTPI